MSMRIQTQTLELSSSPLTSEQHPMEKSESWSGGAYTLRKKLPSASKTLPWPLLHLLTQIPKAQRLENNCTFSQFSSKFILKCQTLVIRLRLLARFNFQDFSCSTSSNSSKAWVLGYWMQPMTHANCAL